ncbi:beta strand repeat-containing protein [Rudanella lutea]|uniref:beta strand repeat-containing protein n=1 Tax=Rudanella lutea TaxID=451374 RepID=UPI0003653255|nr:hypothetical protein [Rudanella lutea]
MKKIILTGAALMAFAAVSYAQSNSATLNQNGNGQAAEQTQTGTYQNSNIQQDKQSATNAGNFAGTTQNTSGQVGTAPTNAFINQLGGSNQNWADINQSGGRGSTATINQNNTSGGAGSGSPTVGATAQSAVEAAGGNYADVDQVGATHTATVNQNGTNTNASMGNFADVDQGGSSQMATVNQNAGANGASANNNATVTQNGAFNVAATNQNDRSAGNTATVTQFGSGASTAANQLNTVITRQNGNNSVQSAGNQITVTQGAAGTPILNTQALATQLGASNEITIMQIGGNGNRIVNNGIDGLTVDPYVDNAETMGVIQVGTGNRTTVNQNGTNNNANEIEAFGNANTTAVDQLGNNNDATVRMTPIRGTGNDNNNIQIQQTGNNNNARFILRAANTTTEANPNFSITQTGDEHWARVQVYGDAASQSGTAGKDNEVVVSQSGTNTNAATRNLLNAAIDGDNNVVKVTQNSGTALPGNSIGTTGDASGGGINNGDRGLYLSGDFSDVELSQTGNGNQINMAVQSTATALSEGNTVDVTQTGNNNRVGTGGGGGTTVDNASARGLYISGNSNQVSITQDGGDETKAKQNGNDKLTVKQQGGVATASAQSNRVLIDQQAGYNEADITQNGSGNFVYGLGGANTFATQQGGTMADPNKLNITQSTGGATGNNAFVGQNGVGNLINITQSK